ncbi:MAG TPA: hypothetical protein VFU17_12910 [Candidatus Limnocylindrales bacterium]|nr:hypothetical protein [Candidatus Limnocylindrales bacterium]
MTRLSSVFARAVAGLAARDWAAGARRSGHGGAGKERLMLQISAAVVLAVHGLIHLIGFVVPWQLATVDGFPYRTTVLAGYLDVGEIGARVVGGLWLACALGFVLAAFALWRGERRAMPLVVGLAIASLVLCVLGLPGSEFGVVVNVAILAVAAYLVLSWQATAGFAQR